MTIRSHALTAALVGAAALVPARRHHARPRRDEAAEAGAAVRDAAAQGQGAARHIRLENQALDIINAATRHVRGTVSGCAFRNSLDGRHGETHDRPSPDFMNAIAALRRPATQDELDLGAFPPALLPGETYVDYRRNVTAANGRKLTIVLGRAVRPSYAEPQRCLDAEHARILELLKGKPHALRSVTLQEYGQLRAVREEAGQPRTPVDGVYLFQSGGGGGGADFAYFKKHGIFGSSGGGEGSSTIDGLVPDGVATVKLSYPKVLSRGRYYKPKVFPSAYTVSLRVQENVVSATVPRSAPDALARHMVWRDAAGRVVNDVTQP